MAQYYLTELYSRRHRVPNCSRGVARNCSVDAEIPRIGERHAMAVHGCKVAVAPAGGRGRARTHLSLWPQSGRAEMAMDHLGQRLCRCCLDCAVPVVLLVCCQFG